MTRKDTKHAVAAAQRVYAPSSMQNNQAGPPNTSGSGQAHVAQHSDRHHELYLPEDSRHRSSSATLAPRSKPAPAEIPRERNSQSSTLPTNLPLENKCKPSDLHSEDAQATVVESDSDDAEEAGELLSPETMPVFDPSDLFFMIMGVTGAGKSTFISLLTEENVEVGHALQSNTKQVSFYELRQSGGKRAWLIDTPGFDDTERENLDLLKELIACLTMLDKRGGRIAGIFYLHRITDPRMAGSAMKSLAIFKLLVGAPVMPLVRLVSTRWNDVEASASDLARAEALEKQLCTTDKFWGSCVAEGAVALRHRGDRASAQAVINSALQANISPTPRLSIVQELHDKNMPLLDTGVGRFISEDTDKLARQYEADIANLKREQQSAMEEKDHELAQQLASEQLEFERRTEQIARIKKEFSNTYVPPQSSMPMRTATRESTGRNGSKRGKKSKVLPPPPPPPHRAPEHGDRVIESLNRKYKHERRVMEDQLSYERKKNRRDRPRRSQGPNRFFQFLMNGYIV